jgi:hypothetical protein
VPWSKHSHLRNCRKRVNKRNEGDAPPLTTAAQARLNQKVRGQDGDYNVETTQTLHPRQTAKAYSTHYGSKTMTRRELCAPACSCTGKPIARRADGSMDGEGERSECTGKSGSIQVDPVPSGNITCTARWLTFVWCFTARKFEEPLYGGKQMGTVPWTVYAPQRCLHYTVCG